MPIDLLSLLMVIEKDWLEQMLLGLNVNTMAIAPFLWISFIGCIVQNSMSVIKILFIYFHHPNFWEFQNLKFGSGFSFVFLFGRGAYFGWCLPYIEQNQSHLVPTMPEPFHDPAPPGHCPWQCALEKHRGTHGHWKPCRCEVATPERYDDVADIALTSNGLHVKTGSNWPILPDTTWVIH